MKRILILGCPGSGKSTFARKLRDKTGLPLHYLDRMFWNEDKTCVDPETLDSRIRAVLREPQWIIDGNYKRTIPMRLEACDTVFLMDLPMEVCLSGAISRIGKVREDMPWVEDDDNAEFLDYIRSFHTDQLPRLRAMLEAAEDKQVITFTSREQAQQYLDSLPDRKESV